SAHGGSPGPRTVEEEVMSSGDLQMSSDQAPQTLPQPAPGTPTPAPKPAPRTVSIHDSALKQLKRLLEQRQTPQAGLRVAVKGGGCSGLAYQMEWAEQPRERDKIFERDGVRVFVDPKSYLYLIGTELVY